MRPIHNPHATTTKQRLNPVARELAANSRVGSYRHPGLPARAHPERVDGQRGALPPRRVRQARQRGFGAEKRPKNIGVCDNTGSGESRLRLHSSDTGWGRQGQPPDRFGPARSGREGRQTARWRGRSRSPPDRRTSRHAPAPGTTGSDTKELATDRMVGDGHTPSKVKDVYLRLASGYSVQARTRH